MNSVIHVNDDQFEEVVLKAELPVLVDFWAPWCGPCRSLSPVIEELASDYASGVKVTKLNVDENPLTASQYGIRSIPTMLFFREGRLVERLVGAHPKQEIEKHLLAIIKTNLTWKKAKKKFIPAASSPYGRRSLPCPTVKPRNKAGWTTSLRWR